MLAAALGGGLLAATLAAGAHPADGPDLDARCQIRSDRVSIALRCNLAYIDEVLQLPRAADDDLTATEQQTYRAALAAYFGATEHLELLADDERLVASLRDFAVEPADDSLLPLFPRAGARALTKVELTFDYPLAAPARRVAVRWGEFPDDLALDLGGGAPPMRIGFALLAPDGRSRFALSVEEPEFVWHDVGRRPGRELLPVPTPADAAGGPRMIPWLGVASALLGLVLALRGRRRRHRGLIGGGVLLLTFGVSLLIAARRPQLPTVAAALAAFAPLHENVYRAFGAGSDDEAIYDALAQCAHGDLLDRLYRRVYESLILHDEGGAMTMVERMEPLETTIEQIHTVGADDAPAFVADARWRVTGSVHHWGHGHRRTQEYRARYTVVRTPAGWRLLDQDVQEQRIVADEKLDDADTGGR